MFYVEIERVESGYFVRRLYAECVSGRFSGVEYWTGRAWRGGRDGRAFRKVYRTEAGAKRAAERLTR